VAPWDADRYAAADVGKARDLLVAGIDDLLDSLG
jgi:hypothetical protein